MMLFVSAKTTPSSIPAIMEESLAASRALISSARLRSAFSWISNWWFSSFSRTRLRWPAIRVRTAFSKYSSPLSPAAGDCTRPGISEDRSPTSRASSFSVCSSRRFDFSSDSFSLLLSAVLISSARFSRLFCCSDCLYVVLMSSRKPVNCSGVSLVANSRNTGSCKVRFRT